MKREREKEPEMERKKRDTKRERESEQAKGRARDNKRKRKMAQRPAETATQSDFLRLFRMRQNPYQQIKKYIQINELGQFYYHI